MKQGFALRQRYCQSTLVFFFPVLHSLGRWLQIFNIFKLKICQMINELIKIYNRDLDRLKQEMEAFHQENNLWRTTGGVSNSAGNLCLHLIGNLKTYIGKNMGNYHYLRDRDAEFSLKDVSRQRLVEQVEQTKDIVLKTLRQMENEALATMHTEDALGFQMTNGFFLIHLAAHLSYHLGQINYLRRVLE